LSLKVFTSFSLSLCIAAVAAPGHAAIAQSPLILGGGNVPGNLALVPSVEYPTVISVANIEAQYHHTASYVGNSASAKCDSYVREAINHHVFGSISGDDGGGYFTPTRKSKGCTNSDEWSGNYLNWATTQTIDPFRLALTGGYRVVDTTSQTIIEKATRANRGDYFDDRNVTGDSLIRSISPYTKGTLASSIKSSNTQRSASIQNYQKNKTLRIINDGDTKFYSVRVEVCKNSNLLEENCVQYGN